MKFNKRRIRTELFLLLLLPFAWFGCSDAPTDIGAETVENQGLSVTEVAISQNNSPTVYTKDTTYKSVVALGAAKYLLIGNAKGIEASIALKFYPMISGLESAIQKDSVLVTKAKVIFYSGYKLGDSTAPFGITAHKIQSSWTAGTIKSDSIDFLNPASENVSSSFRIDTSYASFLLDTALVRQWLKAGVDTTQPKNYGLLLKPAPGTGKILGWDALAFGATAYPTLQYTCVRRGISGDSTYTINVYDDVHFIKGNLPVPNGDDFYVQSGLLAKSNLWFDLSGIPKNAVINKATLTVKKHADSSRSFAGSNFNDALNVYYITDSSANSLLANVATQLKRADSVYSGNVTDMVTLFYANGKNANFQLTTAEFINGVDRIALFNSKASNPLYRPKLTILYSRRAN